MAKPNAARQSDAWRLDGVALLIGTAGMLSLVLASRLLPNTYFAYSELIRGYSGYVSPLSIFIRFAIPFAISFSIVWRKEVTEREAMVAGALTSLFLTWGPIMTPRIFLSSDLYDRRYLLYVVYLVFATAFTLVCRAGALAGIWVRTSPRLSKVAQRELTRGPETVRAIMASLIAAALYTLLSRIWTH